MGLQRLSTLAPGIGKIERHGMTRTIKRNNDSVIMKKNKTLAIASFISWTCMGAGLFQTTRKPND